MKRYESLAPTSSAPEERQYASSHSLLSKIAHLYYIEGLGQREIALRMNISAASVSRSLAKARELKIVTVSIQGGENDFSQIEIEIERAYSLKECLVVPSYGRIEYTYQGMAAATADLFSRTLRPGNTLGVSWGETLKAIGENLPRVSVDRVDVIPIVGAMGRIETGIYPNSIARTFATKLGGSAYLVNTPAFVDSPDVRNSLMEDSGFRSVREIWSHLDMAVVGVGDFSTDSSMYRSGIFMADELETMKRDGSACISNFVPFDARGQVVRTQMMDRLVCLPVDDLSRIPNVVIITAGLAKSAPLCAMLRSGICETLIIDVDCARGVLGHR